MATKTASGFIVEEKPQSITQQSADQGLGTPESPLGAKVAGANADQAKMVGTPAQQKSAQQLRQERESGPTLEQKQRYDQKPSAAAVDSYGQAKEKAQGLAQLGPVKTRVQSLIEQRMSDVQQTTAQLSANEAKISSLPADQQEIARVALDAYLADPTEKKLQSFYNVVGEQALAEGGVGSFVTGEEDVMQQLAQQQLGGQVTLDQLDLTQLGIDMGQLEAQLGLEPGGAAGMSLDDLDAAIDQVEAQQLNQVEQIRAQLSDPNLPPQQRQALLRELSQLSAAGMTGMEAQIDQLDQQISAADTLEIGGREMSLEEALGDDGISATIANAIQDPKYLEDLKDLPGFEGLGEWIETNKELLTDLVGDLEESTGDFLDTQREYQGVRTSLGEDGEELLKELFPNVNWDDSSILSGNLEAIKTKLEGNNAYQFLVGNPEKLAEAKQNPEYMADIKTLANRDFEPEDIGNILDMMSETEQDKTLQTLMGDLFDLPADEDDYLAMSNFIERYENLSPEIMTADTNKLIKDGVLDMDELELLSEDEFGVEILGDIIGQRDILKKWGAGFKHAENDVDYFKELVFGEGNTDFSAFDVNHAIANAPEKASKMIRAIFDLDDNGVVTEYELNHEDVVSRAFEELGLNASTEDLRNADGTWDVDSAIDYLGTQIQSGEYTKSTKNTITASLTNRQTKYIEERDDIDKNQIPALLKEYGLKEGSFGEVMRNRGPIKNYMAAKKDLDSSVSELKKLNVDKIPGRGWVVIDGRKMRLESLQNSPNFEKIVKAHDLYLKRWPVFVKEKANTEDKLSGTEPKVTLKSLNKLNPRLFKEHRRLTEMRDDRERRREKIGNQITNLETLSEEELKQLAEFY